MNTLHAARIAQSMSDKRTHAIPNLGKRRHRSTFSFLTFIRDSDASGRREQEEL
jgi:hypothetical protein